MKPYLKFIRNKILLFKLKVKCNNVHFNGLVLFDKDTKIVLGKNSELIVNDHLDCDGRCVIFVEDNAKLSIGKGCYFNEGTMISTKSSVSIGNGVKFGPNVKIFDNNHEFNKNDGVLGSHNSTPVTIGDNSWLASNVVVLKGTTIGKNCVIGANCVVKGNIPDRSIVTQESRFVIKPME